MFNPIIRILAILLMLTSISCIPAKMGAAESRPVRIGHAFYSGLPRWSPDGGSLLFLSSTSEFGKETQTDLARWTLHSSPSEVEWLTSREFVFHFRPSNVPNLISLVRMNVDTGDNAASVLDLERGAMTDLAVHRQRALSPYIWRSGESIFVLDSGRVYRMKDGGFVPVESGTAHEDCQNVDYEIVRSSDGKSLLFLCARKGGFVRFYDLYTGMPRPFPLAPASETYDVAVHSRSPVFALAVSEVWKDMEPGHRILIFEDPGKGWSLRASIPTGKYLVRFVGWAGDRLVWQEISLADPDYSGEGAYDLADGAVSRSSLQRLIVGVSESAVFFVPSRIRGFVRKSGTQLWAQPLTAGDARALLLDAGQVRNADVSPDGQWIAAEVRKKPAVPYAEVWVVRNPLWNDREGSQ
jgi:hypothetical protein